MFIIKDNYYLYIENLNDINLNSLKNNKKFNIILRNPQKKEISEIIKFRKKCNIKKYKFFIANEPVLVQKSNADGLYISAYNKKKYYLNKTTIGSAHNLKEINEKIHQKCKTIIFSRLFKTDYKHKKSYLGTLKFNLLSLYIKKNLIPLGGINHKNLLKLNNVLSDGFAILSGLKKKPVITNRLF